MSTGQGRPWQVTVMDAQGGVVAGKARSRELRVMGCCERDETRIWEGGRETSYSMRLLDGWEWYARMGSTVWGT